MESIYTHGMVLQNSETISLHGVALRILKN